MARAYTKDPAIAKKRGVHTVYAGTGGNIGSKEHKVRATVFIAGVKKDIEGQEFAQLKDLGHAVAHKPSTEDDE